MPHSFDYYISEDDSVSLHVSDDDLETAGQSYLEALTLQHGLKRAMRMLNGYDIKTIQAVIDIAEQNAIDAFKR